MRAPWRASPPSHRPPATRPGRRGLTAVAVGAALLTAAPTAGATTVPSPSTTRAAVPELRCAEPTGRGEPARASAAASGMDDAALGRAISTATARAGGSVAVYRYGCLVASAHAEGPERGYQSWSASKSVVSMAVARAMQLGLLSMDDTVGSLIPEADAAHGRITVRQLLQQNSGLHQNLVRDYNFILDDHLQNALTLPFDHAPGSHFTYGQVTVSLLAEVVGRAAGEDYQAFLRRELFAPLGIPADAAAIHRDRAGRTDGYMGIEMATKYWSRLGRLLLQDGSWGGRRLLHEDWTAQVARPTATNACYALLFWPDAPGCTGRWAPADGYEMNGLGEQIVWVVPSQSLVVVRFGSITSGVKDPLKEAVTKAIRAPSTVPERAPERDDGKPAVDPDEAFRTILNLQDVLAVAGVRLEPLPGAGPARARALQVRTRALTATRDGAIDVPVSCPRTARMACAGSIDAAAAGAATAATPAATTAAAPALARG
ncbi:serine hydrolase, partial [Patulibacter sp.]|uniref:serine hydrolase domain-containing protein n=1 Tax=Patulibacter sp. TaxID=1912859 RepID=UPI00271FE75E